jgi:hypothetical protein
MNDREICSTRQIRPTLERRQSQRYAVSAPVIYRWTEADGPEHQGGGFTQNMSTQGTYITANSPFPNIATNISVEIQLPALEAQMSGLVLKAEGWVVRAGSPFERSGFAVKTNFDAAENS